jgi:hypothetical protein
MTLLDWLTTREIGQTFAEEMEAVGGSVTDRFDDADRLFLRAVLPGEREVRPGDRLHGGVALRATDAEIWVHPYVFRQVCSNGAIRAHATQSLRLERQSFFPGDTPEVERALRESIRDCCAAEAFRCGAEEMKSSLQSGIDAALTMIPFLSRMRAEGAARAIFTTILDRFFENRDPSRFGFLNAVTSVARDTRDPEVRWQLEAFGGGIPILRQEPGPRAERAEERVVERVLVKA